MISSKKKEPQPCTVQVPIRNFGPEHIWQHSVIKCMESLTIVYSLLMRLNYFKQLQITGYFFLSQYAKGEIA